MLMIKNSNEGNYYMNINWQRANNELLAMQAKLLEAIENKEIHQQHVITNKMLQSFSSRAIAVRSVILKKGGKTSGVDEWVPTTDQERYELIVWLSDLSNYKALPGRRIYIPKPGSTKMRPITIPTIRDRIVQRLWTQILDVYQEYGASDRSYGGRIGRNPSQGINQLHYECTMVNYRYILSLDIKGFFNNICQKWLLDNIPIQRRFLETWFEAGHISKEEGWARAPDGIPQGGSASMVLANMTLEGIDTLCRKKNVMTSLRFIDDLINLHKDPSKIDESLNKYKEFLAERGLEVSEEKTVTREIREGFSWLGFEHKEFSNSMKKYKHPLKTGPFLHIPLESKQKNFIDNLRELLRSKKCSSAAKVIIELNPVIRGWSNYYKCGNITKVYNNLGRTIYGLLWAWILRKHKNTSKKKLKARYFKSHSTRKEYTNNWTFFSKPRGRNRQEKVDNEINPIKEEKDEEPKVITLFDIQSVKVQPQNTLKKGSNPYKPEHYQVFNDSQRRRLAKDLRLSNLLRNYIQNQKNTCGWCQLNFSDWDVDIGNLEVDHKIEIVDGGSLSDHSNLQVLHKWPCHQEKTLLNRQIRAQKKKERKLMKEKESQIKQAKKNFKMKSGIKSDYLINLFYEDWDKGDIGKIQRNIEKGPKQKR